MHTETELFAIAAELGLTDECAREMVAEHIAHRDEKTPNYVRLGLNRATSINGGQFKINCAKTIRFLDKRFSFNSDNVHTFAGFTVNRNKLTSEWYVA